VKWEEKCPSRSFPPYTTPNPFPPPTTPAARREELENTSGAVGVAGEAIEEAPLESTPKPEEKRSLAARIFAKCETFLDASFLATVLMSVLLAGGEYGVMHFYRKRYVDTCISTATSRCPSPGAGTRRSIKI